MFDRRCDKRLHLGSKHCFIGWLVVLVVLVLLLLCSPPSSSLFVDAILQLTIMLPTIHWYGHPSRICPLFTFYYRFLYIPIYVQSIKIDIGGLSIPEFRGIDRYFQSTSSRIQSHSFNACLVRPRPRRNVGPISRLDKEELSSHSQHNQRENTNK